MKHPVLFALTVLAILATPGPTNMLLAAGGAAVGVRRSLLLVVAEALGYGMAISAIGLVLKPALAQLPAVEAALQVLVGIYLLGLAWRLFDGSRGMPAGKPSIITPRQVFLATLLNPKAFVFALAVVPFGQPEAGLYLAGFVGILVPVSIGWLSIGAALGGLSSRRGKPHWITRLGACVIALFAALILMSGVRGIATARFVAEPGLEPPMPASIAFPAISIS